MKLKYLTLPAILFTGSVLAAGVTVTMNEALPDGNGKALGTVTVTETPYGLLFSPKLTGLAAGIHGFAHLGPYNDKGHLGDLPGLVVNADGTATYQILAPRLKSLSELKQHALMIHVGGDNYADHPMPLGGGGARMACGVIE
jgi:superoxide dismutase, Cu-Zn family